MKKTLILISSLALLSAGCNSINGTKSADGSLKIRANRFMWASEGVDFSVKDEKGFTTTLKVAKSKSDTEMLGTVTSAAVEAALNHFAPAVTNK